MSQLSLTGQKRDMRKPLIVRLPAIEVDLTYRLNEMADCIYGLECFKFRTWMKGVAAQVNFYLFLNTRVIRCLFTKGGDARHCINFDLKLKIH